jgi:hypothetical protein
MRRDVVLACLLIAINLGAALTVIPILQEAAKARQDRPSGYLILWPSRMLTVILADLPLGGLAALMAVVTLAGAARVCTGTPRLRWALALGASLSLLVHLVTFASLWT